MLSQGDSGGGAPAVVSSRPLTLVGTQHRASQQVPVPYHLKRSPLEGGSPGLSESDLGVQAERVRGSLKVSCLWQPRPLPSLGPPPGSPLVLPLLITGTPEAEPGAAVRGWQRIGRLRRAAGGAARPFPPLPAAQPGEREAPAAPSRGSRIQNASRWVRRNFPPAPAPRCFPQRSEPPPALINAQGSHAAELSSQAGCRGWVTEARR